MWLFKRKSKLERAGEAGRRAEQAAAYWEAKHDALASVLSAQQSSCGADRDNLTEWAGKAAKSRKEATQAAMIAKYLLGQEEQGPTVCAPLATNQVLLAMQDREVQIKCRNARERAEKLLADLDCL